MWQKLSRILNSFLYYKLNLIQVIRTKHENKARGFGFVSFMDPMDCAKAIREMQGKYLGTRYLSQFNFYFYFLFCRIRSKNFVPLPWYVLSIVIIFIVIIHYYYYYYYYYFYYYHYYDYYYYDYYWYH